MNSFQDVHDTPSQNIEAQENFALVCIMFVVLQLVM